MANVGGSKLLLFKGGGDVSPRKYIVATPMAERSDRYYVMRSSVLTLDCWLLSAVHTQLSLMCADPPHPPSSSLRTFIPNLSVCDGEVYLFFFVLFCLFCLLIHSHICTSRQF